MLSMQALYHVVFYPKSHARRFLLKDKATLRQQRTRRAGDERGENETSAICYHTSEIIYQKHTTRPTK